MIRWPLFAFLSALLWTGTNLRGQGGDFLTEEELFGDFEDEAPAVPDPLKPLNKAIFAFNDVTYRWVVEPVAKGYDAITPDAVQTGLSNFFTNWAYPVRLTSNALQGRIAGCTRETGRFILNSTVGLGGFLRPADSVASLTPIPNEDIGQALGSWGIGEGFYIVLPFLGPSTMRDLVGYTADQCVHPFKWPIPYVIEPWTPRLILTGVEITNDSPELINSYKSIIENSIDPYTAIKDGYIENRRYAIEQ